MLLQVTLLVVLIHHSVSDSFHHVGCYDDTYNDRAMPQLLAVVANPTECFEKVRERRWPAFGTQYGKECWSSEDADKTYMKHGKSKRCKNDMGNELANDVWMITYDGNATNAPSTEKPTTTCEIVSEDHCSWFNTASIKMVSGLMVVACAFLNFASLMF